MPLFLSHDRFARSPVRYGRSYRSRSSRINLGFNDIRNRINRIIRGHSVTLGMVSNIDREVKSLYRYFSTNSHMLVLCCTVKMIE